MKKTLFVFCLLAFLAASSFTQEKDFPVLKGPYLGQKPPGKKAQPFAFDIFGSKNVFLHSNIIFSPSGKEAYWQQNIGDGSKLQAIFESKYENGIWTKPQVAFFSILVKGGIDDAPIISPDGKKFFFLSGRPIGKGDLSEKYNIWVMDRTEEGWSDPQPLPPIVNSLEGFHWRLSVDIDGNLYFGTWKLHGEGKITGDIYCSKQENGQYTKPEKLGPEINAPGYNFNPFIAPEGSYLLFNRRPFRLFICFRKSDGTWTKPKDLGVIIGRDGGCPLVTPDAKYLFFMDYIDGKTKPFWMEAGFIEELRKTELKKSK